MTAWTTPSDLETAMQMGGEYLLSAQRSDGGFGWPEVDQSDAWTTSECLLGLAACGMTEAADVGLDWLRGNVLEDGGWSSEAYRNVTHGAGDVSATAYSMRALACCGTPDDRPLIQGGSAWLVSRQRADGSWGVARPDEDRGHIGQTGFAISALSRSPTGHRAAEAVQSALYFLYESQRLTGGWGLAPGHEVDPTLTAYALRGIIDAAVLRGQRPQPRIFLRWLTNIQQGQNPEGAWSDWFGNVSSVEAAAYTLELAACLGFAVGDDGDYRPWARRALSFLAATQSADGAWRIAPGEEDSPWATHNVLLALAALLGRAQRILCRLDVLASSATGDLVRDQDAELQGKVYDFAISFASSQRDFARALAIMLQQRGASVFFDSFESESLWGANLIDRFTHIYREGSRLCIMIISPDYVQRVWPKLERQSAQARAMTAEQNYILPIRVGSETSVPGLLETVGYLDAEVYDLDEIAALAMGKLAHLKA